ncbi:hypothetical protein GJV85_03095 [Sulfurimonas aquatica]|uniref:HTH luxR-type domain-containing protein n=1 Tax=Sulfurimonas aquatica TaxID=2672570 RepID=A0A975GCC8_9BACT|nr:response regulator transcription factor [Sulfurimonas aquatica]QSZ41139.1 hypothetical protein GJV85_03095 [Sulfurimonas aquatica]
MKTVLYSDDINLLSHWQKSLENLCDVYDDLDSLYEIKESIIIINFSACLPECSYVLAELNKNNNRVLILHRTPDFEVAKKMIHLGAFGYGNALMRDHFIVSAVNTIRDGMVWLYPEYTSQLIMEIRPKEENQDALLVSLTSREKEVALLLKDGLTYKDIAIKLDITPRTVKAHAQNTYAKLHVKDRVALALLLK